MPLFRSRRTNNQVSNLSTTDIDTTNIQQTDQSVNTGLQVRGVNGGVVVTDSSPEVITLANTAVGTTGAVGVEAIRAADRQGARNAQLTSNIVGSIGSAANNVINAQSRFAGDLSSRAFDAFETVNERAFDAQENALDVVSQTGREATGFLTQLTDNVLARDAVQNIAARTEGQLNEALRAVENVGTTGSQNTQQRNALMIGGVILGLGVIWALSRRG